jgi:multiple sugar transport system ATP-binding protein
VEAMTLATRMAVMRGGVIQQIGTPAEVYAHPNNLFVATFLGSPGMNLLKGALHHDASAVRFRNDHIDLDVSAYRFRLAPLENQPCVLGVRPEDVLIDPSFQRRGTVSLVEPMGNHRVIWLDYHGAQIASIAQDSATAAVDEITGFSIESKRISLFDEPAGDRL